MSAQPSPEGPSDGFTLIEALAALTVVVVVLGALAELTHSTVRRVVFAERRGQLISLARKILAAAPGRGRLTADEGALDDQRWRLSVRPYISPSAPSAGGRWTPELVTLEVSAADGSRLEIDSVRLVPGGAP